MNLPAQLLYIISCISFDRAFGRRSIDFATIETVNTDLLPNITNERIAVHGLAVNDMQNISNYFVSSVEADLLNSLGPAR